MSNDVGITELVVSADPGVQIRCTAAQDGSIAIQTRNGSINILFQHVANAGSHQSKNVDQRTLWTLSKSSVSDDEGATFCFTHCGVEDGAEEEVDTADDDDDADEGDIDGVDSEEDISIDDNDAEEVVAEEEEDNDGDVAEGVKGRPSKLKKPTRQKRSKQMSEKMVKEHCRNINTKIVEQWKNAQPSTKKRLDKFITDPYTFFGRKDFVSSEQWSYYSLRDSEGKSHLYRNPFHKVHLTKCQYSRKQISAADNPELTSRRAMLEEIEPGFNRLSRKEKLPKYKQFERCLNQGEVLLLMLNQNAGLLLTVAPFISTKNFEFLWKYKGVPFVFGLCWLCPAIREESQKYSALAMEILSFMPRYTTNSKRKAQDLHEDPSQKRPHLLPVPNDPSLHDSSQYGPRGHSSQPQMINPQQRPFLPTPESSQEHIPTRDQAMGSTQVLQIQPSPLPTPPSCENAPLPGSSLEFLDKIRTMVLKRSFDDSTYLLLLAYALGSSLPKSLVVQTQSAQLRWSNDGTEQKVTAFEAGLDPQLVEILATENRLSEALTFFDKSPDASQPWTITRDIQIHLPKILTEREKEKWSIEALNWVCFAFPRISHRELQYTSLVRSLLPLLDHALQEVELSNIPNFLKHAVSEALLAASKIEGIRRDVLPKVAKFVDKESPLHLQAELALEKSILSRLGGDFDDSERAIHDFCCRCGTFNDKCIPRFFQQGRPARVKSPLSTMHGLLHRSHLENLVQCEKYDLAKQQVNDWEMPPAPSPMEVSILPSRILTSSKVFRSQGDFTAARERLEMCLKVLKGHEQVGSQVLCQLLDIYSDLELPQLATELIAPKIEKWKKKAPKSKALRRILISSIDIDLQREHYHDANKTIEELSSTFEGLQNLNVSDELLHIRLLIASARINYLCSEFDQAIQRWKVALDHVQKYASFHGEGFTYAVIHLSISLAYLEMDESGEAVISFNHGQRILREGMRDYWIPTLQAWFRYVASKMQSMAGWIC